MPRNIAKVRSGIGFLGESVPLGLRDALHLKITSLVSQNVAMSEIIHVGTFFRAAARRSLRWFGWVWRYVLPV